MNNAFDIKRFCNYFLYDLRNAKNNYGLSTLILGCMPIVLFLIVQLINLIFFQRFSSGIAMPVKYAQAATVFVVASLGAGTKIFGHVTEKRAGSNFLMLPASTLEKWLSMALVVCIAVPLALLALQIGSDALMSLFFPNSYGARLYELVPLQKLKDTLIENGIHFQFGAYMFMEWCESILLFTLGAIIFKKSKIAKTILCLIAFSFIMSTIMTFFIGFDQIDVYVNWLNHFDSADSAVRFFNWSTNISFGILLAALLGGMYYRIRTLKH